MSIWVLNQKIGVFPPKMDGENSWRKLINPWMIWGVLTHHFRKPLYWNPCCCWSRSHPAWSSFTGSPWSSLPRRKWRVCGAFWTRGTETCGDDCYWRLEFGEFGWFFFVDGFLGDDQPMIVGIVNCSFGAAFSKGWSWRVQEPSSCALQVAPGPLGGRVFHLCI